MNPHLICFAKAPEAGRVKTRLAAGSTDAYALQVYVNLLEHSATLLQKWTGQVSLVWDGDEMRTSLPGNFARLQQYQGNLGERLLHGCNDASPHEDCIAIGTDCPFITTTILSTLCQQTTDVVFGRTNDGGYWGILIRQAAARSICFASDLPWSQETLLTETCQRLKNAGFSYALGPELIDIDTMDDLAEAQQYGYAAPLYQ